jgi:hypothetical protein
MRATRRFPWLPLAPTISTGPLRVWAQWREKTIYSHLHFSAYGKFEQQKCAERKAIGELIQPHETGNLLRS